MPSNTRRASKSKSPNSGTRSVRKNSPIGEDHIVEAMKRGNLKWGDLMNAKNHRSASPRSPRSLRIAAPPASPASPAYVPINDVFNNFVTPDLRLRKFIWEKFPVVLEEITTRNGREMYAVKWHRRNLEAWRSERTTSYDEAMEYELFSELRLIHSLRKFPHLYALHEPRSKDEIVVIEMLGAARAPLAAPAARARSPPRPRGAEVAGPRVPELRKLNDITTHFPGVVVWEKVEGRRGESTYALKVRGDFARKAGAGAERIKGELEAALRASRFWSAMAGDGSKGEWMRLEMQHA